MAKVRSASTAAKPPLPLDSTRRIVLGDLEVICPAGVGPPAYIYVSGGVNGDGVANIIATTAKPALPLDSTRRIVLGDLEVICTTGVGNPTYIYVA